MLEKVPKIFSQMVVFHGDESHVRKYNKNTLNNEMNNTLICGICLYI